MSYEPKERWLIRLMVDRDPDTEATPDEWEWPDATLVSVQMVGILGGTGPAEPLPNLVRKLEQGGRR